MTKVEPNGYCIECSEKTTHPDAYFCGLCAGEFYNMQDEGEGTE